MTRLQRLARFSLRVFGWELLDLPDRPSKAVVIGYPHTSYWDAFIVVPALIALGTQPHWLAAEGLFLGWLRPLLVKLGGIPVNRRQRTGFVARMVAAFADHPVFLLTIAPEGTRQLAAGWKSGFYRIAVAAQVPVMAGVLDYRRKQVGFAAVLDLTGLEAIDLARIAQAYEGHHGHTPAKASPIRLLK